MLVNAQSHKYKGTRQNMLMTIHNNVDQTFGFSTFYVFLDFLTQKQEMIDKKKK